MGELINKIGKDGRVELTDELYRNFERKAFFGRPWAPVKDDPGVGSMLMRTGMLRKSITARSAGGKIAFTSSVKYARIQNEGGPVTSTSTVTPKMRRWAWAKYRETKDEKYRGLAMTRKKVIKRSFVMPSRRFIGPHPVVTKAIKDISDQHIKKYIDNLNSKL